MFEENNHKIFMADILSRLKNLQNIYILLPLLDGRETTEIRDKLINNCRKMKRIIVNDKHLI